VKTILLADDSITIQKVVELTFSEADYRVVSVSTGAQALKKVGEVRPDIILLDVIMPEKNGYEVCEQLKRSPATSGIPVLLLTGTFEPFDKKRADAAGANGHITKPFESQALVAKVEELIASRPSVAVDEEGGRMDIISGGEVYRVDPGRAGEGMRPASVPRERSAAPPGPAFEAAPATSVPAGSPMSAGPFADEETDPRPGPHPALAPPDPAAGGSFVGFADVGFAPGLEEADIVPDRFDAGDRGVTPGTARPGKDDGAPRRDEARRGLSASPGSARPSGGSEGAFAGAFESEFDLIVETAPEGATASAAASSETGGWAPPPEAPPAETWQDADEEIRETAVAKTQVTPVVRPQPEAAPPSPQAPRDHRGTSLTPEMIDLIADKVVERLADRVVREVAWEVVPGVAEALVRKRIKELEESGS